MNTSGTRLNLVFEVGCGYQVSEVDQAVLAVVVFRLGFWSPWKCGVVSCGLKPKRGIRGEGCGEIRVGGS
jgi:hypothetical protein